MHGSLRLFVFVLIAFLFTNVAEQKISPGLNIEKCQNKDQLGASQIEVNFHIQPHWLILGTPANASCSACAAQDDVIVWSLEEADGDSSMWTVDGQGQISAKSTSVDGVTVSGGVTDQTQGGEETAGMMHAQLTISNVSSALDNATLSCYRLDTAAVDHSRGVEAHSPSKHSGAAVIVLRVYYPPQRPVLRVFYHSPPSTVNNKERLQAVCSAFVGSDPGTLTWRLYHFTTSQIRDKASNSSRNSSSGSTKRAVYELRFPFARAPLNHTHERIYISTLPGETNKTNGPVLNSSFRIFPVDYTLEGASLSCSTHALPGYARTMKSHGVELESHSLPFSVHFFHRKPYLSMLEKGPPTMRAVCDAFVGTDGFITWMVSAGQGLTTSWTVDTRGHVTISNRSENSHYVNVSATVDLTNPEHGPRVISFITVAHAGFPEHDRVTCYSHTARNKTRLFAMKRLVKTSYSVEDEKGRVLVESILTAAAMFAFLASVVIGTALGRRAGTINLQDIVHQGE